MMKKIKIELLITFALCLAACEDRPNDFDATGSFEATEVTVSAEAVGRILSFDVTEGMTVTAQTPLGAIDSVQLHLSRLQLLQSASSVRSNRPDVKKQIAALQQQIAAQQTERVRVENLLLAGAATQKQLDDIRSAIAILERQLAAQHSALQNNVSSLDAQSSAIEIQTAQVEDRLMKCIIRSPVTGTILAKYAEAGELAATGRPLFKIADLQHIYLRAYLTSGQLADIRLGQTVTVFADYGGDNRHEYTGRISWISDKSEFTPKNIQTRTDRENLVYAIKVTVPNDGFIKIGMYGGIKL